MPPSKKTQKRSAKFLDAQYSHVKKKRKLVQKIKKRNVEQTEKKKSREEKQAIKDSEDAAIHAALPKPQYFSESTAEVDLEKFLTKSFGDADEENDNDSNEEDAPLAASDSEEEPTEPVAADLEADQEDSGSGEDEITNHQQELQDLERSDPAFFAYLKENDASLLNFEEGEGSQPDESRDVKDTKSNEPIKKKKKSDKVVQELSLPYLKSICGAVLGGSFTALKKLLVLFRTACHVGDEEQKQDVNMGVKIANGQLFNYIMRFCLKNMGSIFDKLLGRQSVSNAASEQAGSEQPKPVTEFKRWKAITPCVKSYLNHLLHFLTQAAEPTLVRFVLVSLETTVAYLSPFPRFTKKFVKHLLSVWVGPDHNSRIDAFLRLRQLALTTQDLRETIIQGLYIEFVRHAKTVDSQTFPALRFMVNCVVEIIGLDPVTGFQHGFVYIRQLAIHLRNALHAAKGGGSTKSVYNWQFINSLRVWAHVLAAHATHQDSVLKGLVYPFVQVCMAVLGLAPSTKYFPLRFQIVRFLHTLIAAHGPGELFIPLSPFLVSVLTAPELTKTPSKSTAQGFDLKYAMQASDTVVNTKRYQSSCIDEAFALLLEHFSLFSTNVAFPELIVPTKLALKKLKKTHRLTQIKSGVTQLLGKLDLNSQWIVKHRAQLEYSPKDMVPGLDTSFDALLKANNAGLSPLQRYSPTLQAATEKQSNDKSVEADEKEEQSMDTDVLEEDDESEDEEGADTHGDTVTDMVLSGSDEDADGQSDGQDSED